MKKKNIKIKTLLWRKDVTSNFFFANMPFVNRYYNFVETENPDYILYYYAVNPKSLPVGPTRISIPVENKFPDMSSCDWCFGEKYEDMIKHKRYFRLPGYTRLGAGKNLIKGAAYSPEKILRTKKKFCAFIYWNPSCTFRNKFFKALSAYKKVDAPGRACNNMPPIGGRKNWNQVKAQVHSTNVYEAYREKINFLKDYKFCISFANESSVGYTSEKIYHTMLANCIPIYWGNSKVSREFNTKSFLNFHDYGSVKALVDRIAEIDSNDDLYLEHLRQPWLPNNELTKWLNPKRYRSIFSKVFG
jgi:hypothetical protein